jgi:O-antigen ligase
MTFSRGAFLGFMVINMLFLLSRRSPITFLLFVIVLAGALAFAPGAIYERLGTGMDGNMNAVSAGRTEEIWLPLMPEMFKSPIWGSGLMSITWSNAMNQGLMLAVNHPHNAYLGAFLDLGIVGMGLLLAYFVHVWRGFRSLSKDERLSPGRRGFFEGAAAGLISLMVAGVAGGGLTPGPEQVYLWMAIGMMYGEQARAKLAATAAAPVSATGRRGAK